MHDVRTYYIVNHFGFKVKFSLKICLATLLTGKYTMQNSWVHASCPLTLGSSVFHTNQLTHHLVIRNYNSIYCVQLTWEGCSCICSLPCNKLIIQ